MAEFSENRHISNLINMSCKVAQTEVADVLCSPTGQWLVISPLTHQHYITTTETGNLLPETKGG